LVAVGHERSEGSNGPWRLGYRPALDGLRGIAVLFVLVGHSRIGFDRLSTIGVTLFFVLSGFLITTLLVEERRGSGTVDLKAFYIRRALRLFPALGLLLVGVSGILILEGRAGEIADDVIPVALYVGNWALASGGDLGYLDHTWSLAVEEQFYLLWPLVFLAVSAIAPRRLLPFLIILAVVPSILRLVLAADSARAAWGSDTRGDALLIGCIVALVLTSGRRIATPRPAVFGSLFVFVVISTGPPLNGLTLTGVALAGALLVAWAAQGDHSPLASRPLVDTGRISYGLYLWQTPVIFVWLAHVDGPVWARVVWMFVGSFTLALLSWHIVERPALRLKRRWERRGEGEVVMEAAPSLIKPAPG
jgi:peptidoglycan/LPS O-acetylase OafA/YrhL